MYEPAEALKNTHCWSLSVKIFWVVGGVSAGEWFSQTYMYFLKAIWGAVQAWCYYEIMGLSLALQYVSTCFLSDHLWPDFTSLLSMQINTCVLFGQENKKRSALPVFQKSSRSKYIYLTPWKRLEKPIQRRCLIRPWAFMDFTTFTKLKWCLACDKGRV